jgi:hypothetical protein
MTPGAPWHCQQPRSEKLLAHRGIVERARRPLARVPGHRRVAHLRDGGVHQQRIILARRHAVEAAEEIGRRRRGAKDRQQTNEAQRFQSSHLGGSGVVSGKRNASRKRTGRQFTPGRLQDICRA